MMRSPTKKELSMIFPQHNEETILSIYDNVIESLGEDSYAFILPTCIEKLLELPDGHVWNGNKNDNNRQVTNTVRTHGTSEGAKRNKCTLKSTCSKPEYTSLSSDEDESIFERKRNNNNDELNSEILRDKNGLVSQFQGHKRKCIDTVDKNSSIIKKSKTIKRSATKSNANKLIQNHTRTLSEDDRPESQDLTQITKGMSGYVEIGKKKIKDIINDVDNEYIEELINKQEELLPISEVVNIVVEYLLENGDYPKVSNNNTGPSTSTFRNTETINSSIDSEAINISIDSEAINSSLDSETINLSMDSEAINSSIDSATSTSSMGSSTSTSMGSATIASSIKDRAAITSSIDTATITSSIDSATVTSPIESATKPSSVNTVKYNKQAISLLQNNFRKVPTNVVRKIFSRTKSYTKSFIKLKNILEQITSRRKKVEDTAITSFLMGKREEIKVANLSSRLAEEVEHLEKKTRKKKEDEHNLVNGQQRNEGHSVECGCCYNDVTFEDMVQCVDGHLFCITCLQNYSKEAVYGSSKVHLYCMSQGCDSTFPRSQLKKALTEEMLEKYMERVQNEDLKLANLANLVKCPHCEFAADMDDGLKVFYCQNTSCMKQSCRYCKEDWKDHIGLSCKEVEKKEVTNLRTTYEEKMTQAKARKCWQCDTLFVKFDGCNKMTCRCGAKMCYVCRQGKINYEHFCQHPRTPGESCTKCKKCNLWTDPAEDDDRAVAEIKKKAEEESAELAGDKDKSKISIGPACSSSNKSNHTQPQGYHEYYGSSEDESDDDGDDDDDDDDGDTDDTHCGYHHHRHHDYYDHEDYHDRDELDSDDTRSSNSDTDSDNDDYW